ncbi:MFS transporter [Actinomadura violacea]|uniref:MFS transporter n=1 Tax=Actinomadura violacea TaxID=2819934 RepID=A0ABS3S1P5_9ACTN|nr:MFS transporter [Actinomadura violacea]MBO2462648.1 MFS transporter [Actinomadura violacea]
MSESTSTKRPTGPPPGSPGSGPGSKRPWIVLCIMCIGFFMSLLDGAIVNIAIPTLIHSLNASYDQVLWVIDAYMLVFSVLLITTGRLGDIVGYRRMYVIGIVTFTVASALCGFAGSPGALLAARVLQGLGSALLFPQVISVILTTFPPRMRGRAFGVFGIIVGFAPILGPVGGGLLLAHLSWRWIFFINVPIGIVTAILALTIVPAARTEQRHKLDPAGVALATLGLAGIVFGLIEGQRYDWGTITGPISIGAVIAVGVVLLIAFVLWQAWQQKRQGEPLMPLVLFNVRNFSVGNVVGFVFQLGMIGIAFVLVLYLQFARGYSALETGLALLPMAVLTAFGSALSGKLSDKFGGKYILMAGLGLLAVGLFLLVALVGPHTSIWTLMPALLVMGAASGATFTPLQQATMDGVDRGLAGAASGVSSTTRQIGGVLGTAVIGALLTSRLSTTLHQEAERRAGRLPEQLRDRFVNDVTQGAGHYAPAAVPGNLDAATGALYKHLTSETFAGGFSSAMNTTLVVAAVTLVLSALGCLLFTRPQKEEKGEETAPRPRGLGEQSEPGRG